MAADEKFLRCSDFKQALLDAKIGCCISCHEDHDEFGYDLVGLYDAENNVIGEVCCAVSEYLKLVDRSRP